jgi:Ca2+-binding EF-hand superfamily protein
MKMIPITALGFALVASTSAFANESFKQADANADGALSMEEVLAVYPGTTEDQFKAADADGDGALNEVEFAAAVPAPGTTTTTQ